MRAERLSGYWSFWTSKLDGARYPVRRQAPTFVSDRVQHESSTYMRSLFPYSQPVTPSDGNIDNRSWQVTGANIIQRV